MKFKKEGVFNLYEELSKLSDVRRNEGKRHKICDELCIIFEKWSENYIDIKEKEWISLDGKEIRGTMPEEEHKFVNLVSMFATKKKLVFKMGNVDEKSNEIPKVQELIKEFSANKVIFIMDALHCQKKTVDVIFRKKCYYVLQVKNNQKKLYKKVRFIGEYYPKICSNKTTEKNKGRIENGLHYIKDVVFMEDRLKIRTDNAPQNFSLLRSLVMNILRKNGYDNIMQATRLL